MNKLLGILRKDLFEERGELIKKAKYEEIIYNGEFDKGMKNGFGILKENNNNVYKGN